MRGVYSSSELKGCDITREAAIEKLISPDISVSYAASLQAAKLDAGFDLIVMRHVLEHLPDIAGFLREIRRISGQDGMLYAKVPNRASFAARVFGRYWYGLDSPRHLRYFSVSDLTRVLSNAGFRIVRTGHEADTIDWVGSLRFLCVDKLRIPMRGGWAWELSFLGIRALLLPVSLLAQLARRSRWAATCPPGAAVAAAAL